MYEEKGEGGRWTKMSNMPRTRKRGLAVVVDDVILLVGGSTKKGFFSSDTKEATEVDEYNPTTNKWRTLKWTMPTGWTSSQSTIMFDGQSLIIVDGKKKPGTLARLFTKSVLYCLV
jgi:N-acetylneuraminic acid mutarotase